MNQDILPTCYIVGCVRNCAKYLPNVFYNIKHVTTLFREFHIIMAYDKSDDNSLEMLQSYQRSMSTNMTILVNDAPLSMIRTQRISDARNSLLRYMYSDENPNYDFFIMMDMDDVCAGNIHLDVLSASIVQREEWDALSFNLHDYYDIWALSIEPYIISCWSWCKIDNANNLSSCATSVVDVMKKYVSWRLQTIDKNSFLDCDSAFNGFAIYKMDAFKGCVYDNTLKTNMKLIGTERTAHNKEQLQSDLRVTHMILGDRDDCEHRFYHMSAKQLNSARICISPRFLFTS